MPEQAASTLNLLLVEDNPGDAELARVALESSKLRHELHWKVDGASAWKYVLEAATSPGETLPNVILLDLNLPGMHGLELLRQLKQDERFRRIPVVVLSSSQAEQDILQAYDAHANCYIAKPIDVREFCKVIQKVQEFWQDSVILPPERY